MMHAQAVMGHNKPPSEMEILQERLSGYTDETNELARLISREVPTEIADEQEAGKLTDHIKALKTLRSRIEDIFKKEKAPFWACCGAADKWKNDQWRMIDDQIAVASQPVLNFNRKKEEAERQRQLDIARAARAAADALAAEAAAHEEVGIGDTAQELMEMAVQEEQKADMITNNAVHGVVGRSRGGFSSGANRKPWTGKVESRAALDFEKLRNYFTEDDLNKAIRAAVRDGARDIRGARIYQEEKLSVR